jgi:glyoxylase-like metal-dependent hydrolase (beta-lactamase superfamily II)
MRSGTLDTALEEHRISPSEIDVVIHTHLHVDHVGWNFVPTADGGSRLYFERARFFIQQKEWDHWVRPEHLDDERQPHLAQCVAPLADTGRIQFFDGEVAIDENLVFVAASGHTPGHSAIGIQSAGQKGIIVGDASHHPLHLDHPDWSPIFDGDPALAAVTRERLIEDAIREERTWLAGHWPQPGIGRIARVEGKRVFRAL